MSPQVQIYANANICFKCYKYKMVSNSPTFFIYRVSQKTWEFSDEFDIVFVMN